MKGKSELETTMRPAVWDASLSPNPSQGLRVFW